MPKKKKLKKKKKNPRISLTTKLLLSLGSLLIIIPLFFYINEGIQLAFFTPKVPIIPKKYAVPTQVTIDSLYINLPIVEEAITNGSWGVSNTAISHLNTSARPGEVGPIILYGHNTTDRFGPIRWLTNGKKITLKTADGKTHVYIVTKTEDVSPTQINLLTNVSGETLILYTCDGFADLQRFLVFAQPIKS